MLRLSNKRYTTIFVFQMVDCYYNLRHTYTAHAVIINNCCDEFKVRNQFGEREPGRFLIVMDLCAALSDDLNLEMVWMPINVTLEIE